MPYLLSDIIGAWIIHKISVLEEPQDVPEDILARSLP